MKLFIVFVYDLDRKQISSNLQGDKYDVKMFY